MLGNEVGRLRLVGMLEGISFLVLLGIAMPLKYVWGNPTAVSVVGMAHGILFIAYCLFLCFAWGETKWPFGRATLVFLACLVPFGPFLIDRSLKRDEEELLKARRGTPVPAKN